MRVAQPSWSHVFAVWWLLTWRGMVGAVVLGAIAGFALTMAGAAFGFYALAKTLQPFVGAALGLVWGVFVVKQALNKQYENFALQIVEATLSDTSWPPKPAASEIVDSSAAASTPLT